MPAFIFYETNGLLPFIHVNIAICASCFIYKHVFL